MKARVTVTLKRSVMDPQGKAVGDALRALGHKGVQDVRQGKYFELDLNGTDRKAWPEPRETDMLPGKKKSKCRTRTRRAHHALGQITLCPCPKCGKPKLPHAACGVCGYVSAKLVLPAPGAEG